MAYLTPCPAPIDRALAWRADALRDQPMRDRMDTTLVLIVTQREAGSRAIYAKKVALTPSHINNVDNGRTSQSPAVLGVLGLMRLERFGPSRIRKKDAAE